MCLIYKSHISLYGIRATNLTPASILLLFLLLPLLWNLSQQLNYPLNYLSQITSLVQASYSIVDCK